MPGTEQAHHKFEKLIQESFLFQQEQRKRADRAHDFHDSVQWTVAEAQTIEARNQAPSVINIILPTINAIASVESQRRTDYRTLPKEILGGDDVSSILTSAGAQIFNENQFNFFLSKGFRGGLITGISWFEIFPEIDLDTNEAVIKIALRKWEEFFYDQHASRPDLEDARWKSREVWMDLDEAIELYGKDKGNRLLHMFNTFNTLDAFHGQEDEAQMHTHSFVNKKERRIAIHSMYYRNQKKEIRYVVFSGPVFLPWFDSSGNPVETSLDGENPSPYDFNFMPYVPYVAGFDKKGRPLGIVEHLISIQQSINKAQSKQQWLMAAKRCIHETNTFVDSELARDEWSKPDGWIEVNEGALREGKLREDDNIPESNVILGWLSFLVTMVQRISGVSDAVQGIGGVNARSALQEDRRIAQGSGMQTPYIEGLYFTKLRIYKIVMLMIGQFYTGRRVFRLMGADGQPSFRVLNGTGEDGKPFNNIVDILRYDVDVVEEPVVLSSNQLYLNALTELSKVYPSLIPSLIVPILQNIPNLKDRDKIVSDVRAIFQLDQQRNRDNGNREIVSNAVALSGTN